MHRFWQEISWLQVSTPLSPIGIFILLTRWLNLFVWWRSRPRSKADFSAGDNFALPLSNWITRFPVSVTAMAVPLNSTWFSTKLTCWPTTSDFSCKGQLVPSSVSKKAFQMAVMSWLRVNGGCSSKRFPADCCNSLGNRLCGHWCRHR